MAIEGSKAMTNCTCAVCRGFEPWVTNMGGICMIERHITAAKAVEAGTAMWWDANTDN